MYGPFILKRSAGVNTRARWSHPRQFPFLAGLYDGPQRLEFASLAPQKNLIESSDFFSSSAQSPRRGLRAHDRVHRSKICAPIKMKCTLCTATLLVGVLLSDSLALGDAAAGEFRPDQHFSTKTPYWSQQDPATWAPPPPTCKPVLIEVCAIVDR